MILRLSTETSWGLTLGVEVGLVVQAQPVYSHRAKVNLLRRCSLSCPGIRMELGKLSLLRHIRSNTDRSSTALRFPKPQVGGSSWLLLKANKPGQTR